MVIEKLHGLQGTGVSMNDRFTMLAALDRHVEPRRDVYNAIANTNKKLIEEFALHMDQVTRKKSLKQRISLPVGRMRRYSEGSLYNNLYKSNSVTNLNQGQFSGRLGWRGSNSNLSRSASFSNLANMSNTRRRGRGSLRGRNRIIGQFNKNQRLGTLFHRLGLPQGWRGGRIKNVQGGAPQRGIGARVSHRGNGTTRMGRRGARGNMGRGRTGSTRNQKATPTKEELDNELEQYMACTQSALDRQLDEYRKNAMELD